MIKLLDPLAYQHTAETTYIKVSCEVLKLLPWARTEHIGASSILGAISKGDLDIVVLVPDHLHEHSVAQLESVGYKIKLDTHRCSELCMLVSPTDDNIALQVIARSSKFKDIFTNFRDRLLRDPSLVIAYNEVKLKSCHLSEHQYREAKSEFIEKILNLQL